MPISTPSQSSRLSGFYRLPLHKRRAVLKAQFGLDDDDLMAFESAGGLSPSVADAMVENALGLFSLPLGVATNFVINGEPVLIPMAVEEPSVIAACSHIASLALLGGGFRIETDPPIMVGQVQLTAVPDMDAAESAIAGATEEIKDKVNALCPGLVARGGGFVDMNTRVLAPIKTGPHAAFDDDEPMLVVDIAIDCRDAMGANAVNQVAEGLAGRFEALTGGNAYLRILTNLSDRRCARAEMRIPFAALGKNTVGENPETAGRRVAEGIVQAYRFAARDSYRACTHNKGIMNGIDAAAIATGNDWRAIEAGAHAFAAKSGQYTSLSTYLVDDEGLVGRIELPMAVGTVGGATRVHPTVRACRKLLGRFAESAADLAGVLAAVGLSQNCGALKALATEGIQRGHMSLHARQVALAAGAQEHEVERVASVLKSETCFRTQRAEEVLAELRTAGGAS